jgi:hypothetical protein
LSIGIKQYVTVAIAVALSLVCLVVVLETSGPVEPTVGVSSVMSKVSWLPERRLTGLGIIVLTLALTVLILWKLPMRHHLGAEAWGTFVSGNHQTPWRASTNEVIGGLKVATPQLPMASSESADEPLAKGQAEHLDFSAGVCTLGGSYCVALKHRFREREWGVQDGRLGCIALRFVVP